MRWKRHLDPKINKKPFNYLEDWIVYLASQQYPRKWSKIATLL